jgi:transposase
MGIATEQTRKRAIKAYLSRQGTQAQIASLYGVNIRTFQDWLERYRKTGHCAPLPRGHRKAVFDGDSLTALDELVQQHPDATLQQFRDLSGASCSVMAVQRALNRLAKKEVSTHVFGSFNARKAEGLIAPQQPHSRGSV